VQEPIEKGESAASKGVRILFDVAQIVALKVF